MMHKKAQGISMTVIIVAAIALLVLVVLSIIFLGKMGGVSSDLSDCEQKGGVCKQIGWCNSDANADMDFSRVTSDVCDREGQECCLIIGT